MAVESQNKMLDLLSQAYKAVDDIDKIDALMDDINAYLFEDDDTTISKNLPQYAGFDPHLEQHIGQLNNLMSKKANDDQMGLSMGNHAQLIFANDGRILTANSHARTFLDKNFSGYIDDLPFDLAGILTIKQLVKEIAAGVQDIERIIYLKVEREIPLSAFGYCRIIPVGNNKMGLHIALSYFEWSPSIFASLEEALGLSASEGLLLQGVLKGLSRAEIAAERGRSISTIKAQANAVLQKSGCQNLNELAHLCTSIAYVTGLSAAQTKGARKHGISTTPKQAMQTLPLKNNRELAFYEYGDPEGRPVLFFHGFLQGPFFTDDMKRKLLKNGLRLIAPSRPYFGYTSPPVQQKKYIETVNDDLAALLKHLKLTDELVVLAHHAGGGFASRFCNHTDHKIAGMVRIGGGLPVNDEHIKYMSKQTRMAAVASRHAPSLMKLLITLGVKSYRKGGVDEMISKSYSDVQKNTADAAIMQDKYVYPMLQLGMYHLIQQGADGFVHDGRAQMVDWSLDLRAETCKQIWINGKLCPLVGSHFIEKYITQKTNHSVHIVEDSGYNILFQSFDLIIDEINKLK